VAAFFVICALSGLALGGDLALAPSLLADVIEEEEGGQGRAAGAYFGIWNFLNKMNLALAAGLALPLLAWLGYRPGTGAEGIGALSVTYALIPSALKLAAAALLAGFPARSRGPALRLCRRTDRC
jgi:Na+/melibiose symporter-like transporter